MPLSCNPCLNLNYRSLIKNIVRFFSAGVKIIVVVNNNLARCKFLRLLTQSEIGIYFPLKRAFVSSRPTNFLWPHFVFLFISLLTSLRDFDHVLCYGFLVDNSFQMILRIILCKIKFDALFVWIIYAPPFFLILYLENL